MTAATDNDSPAPATLDEARAASAALAAGDNAPAPPKRKRTRKRAATSTSTRDRAPRPTSAARPAPLKTRIENQLSTIGAMVMLVNMRDGALLVQGAPAQAAALDNLAKSNPAVRAALERMLTVSVYGELLTAFAPTVLGILANHGVGGPPVALLGSMMGTPAPDTNGAGDVFDLSALFGDAPPAATPPEGGEDAAAPNVHVVDAAGARVV